VTQTLFEGSKTKPNLLSSKK